ncbi:hypothetical protein OOK31_26500 [Streptomyces sp. NBC_00249]|uniref:hypothetical protein n=1 Tax=Streptomyces sp. NBC_00249 TaxID=2975690 RepID=UPI00225746C9|nr:hypothetical protein [Streptomyces sp. NBC_00249]MCX5197403.1 hypothetical protein [Streptomyces sp. NBC_00249]
MSAALDARQAGARVDEVLDGLASSGDRAACAAAEELVRVLMDFYGAGLARIVERLGAQALAPVLDDDLVASLLSLHDLHPEDVRTRIGRALGSAGDPVELLGFDEATGVLRVRPRAAAAASGCGCGSSSDDAAGQTLEDALACFAPEVTAVEAEPAPAPPPPLLQISTRPQSPVRVP